MVKENYDINVRVTNQKDVDNLARSTDRLNSSLGGLGPIAKAAAGALAAVASVNTIKGFVNVGREVEELGLRFKFLFGSAEEGAKAFDVLNDFASKVPFSLEEISAASGNLAVVADDAAELEEILGIVGNVAAVTGLDFQTTASQIQRSFSGGIAAADIFRERGVRSLLGFKEGAKVTADDTAKRFKEVFGRGGEFEDATDDFSQTLTGTLSMLSDKFRRFQESVAEEFFDELKSAFGELDVALKENQEVLDDVAEAVGKTLAGAVNTAVAAVKLVNDNFEIFKAIGIAGVVFTATKAFLGLAAAIGRTTVAMLAFNRKAMTTIIGILAAAGFVIAEATGKMEDFLKMFERPKTIEDMAIEVKMLTAEIEALEDSGDAAFDIVQTNAANALKEIRKMLEGVKEGTVEFENLNFMIQQIETSLNKIPFEEIELSDPIKKSLSSLDKFNRALGDFGKGFKTGGLEAINAFDAVKLGTTTATNAINTFRQGVADAFTDAIFEAKNFNEAMKEVARTIIKSVVNSIIQLAVQIFIIDKFIKPFFEKMAGGTEKTKNEQKALNNELKKEIGLRAILALFTGGGGFSIPFLAEGGMARRNHPYVVGERGPELFIPNNSGTVVPNDQLQDMMSQPSGGNISVNFTVNTLDASDFSSQMLRNRGVIVNVLQDAMRRQGKVLA